MLKVKVYSSNLVVWGEEKTFELKCDYDSYLSRFCPIDGSQDVEDPWEDEDEALEQCELELIETLKEEFPDIPDDEIRTASADIMVSIAPLIRAHWSFGATLKQERIKCKLTQKSIVETLGIPLRTIEDWESGKRTPPEYVQRFILNELKRKRENG